MKKILILSANPINTSQLRLDEEVREIQIALERSSLRDEFELVTRSAVRIDDLRRTLLDNNPQIIHFSGHGTGTDGIALENGLGQIQLISTEALSNLFEQFKSTTECVLLNACYSETQADAIFQHIDCVIGMTNSIKDDAFYDTIFAGRNYEDAFKIGRSNIELNGIPQHLIPAIKIRENLKPKFSPQTNNKDKNMTGGRNINTGGGNYNERIEGNYVQGNYYAGGQPQSLADAAAEIQKLLDQLSQSHSPQTTMGKMTIATEAINKIDSDPGLTTRVLSAIKAGGVSALEQLLNHPAASFVIAALEDWKNTK
jgi:CHAT domain